MREVKYKIPKVVKNLIDDWSAEESGFWNKLSNYHKRKNLLKQVKNYTNGKKYKFDEGTAYEVLNALGNVLVCATENVGRTLEEVVGNLGVDDTLDGGLYVFLKAAEVDLNSVRELYISGERDALTTNDTYLENLNELGKFMYYLANMIIENNARGSKDATKLVDYMISKNKEYKNLDLFDFPMVVVVEDE